MSNNMQNQWDDEDDFDFEEEDQPKATGNDLVKQLRKADRAKEKRIREMEAELQSLRAEQRTRSVAQVLEAEGVSPKIAKFIPADVTDSDAIKGWLDENAEIFGFTRGEQQAVPSADEVALRRMDSVASGALSPTQIDDIYSQIDRAQSPEEVAALLQQLG